MTVKETRLKNMTNYLFETSVIADLKCTLKDPPNAILLNMNILQAAENTIEEDASAPNRGNLSKDPYKLKYSPTKSKVRGNPQLPKQRIKNNIESKGII